MFEKDKEIIETLYKENEDFRMLLDEHVRFEQDLEALYSEPYSELIDSKIKEIKTLKLRGKDRYQAIMSEYIKNNS